MNPFVLDFYKKSTHIEGIQDPFFEVLFFDDSLSLTWDKLQEMAPSFPRAWFELGKLPEACRIEFIKSYWEKTFPYNPQRNIFLEKFFSRIDDIGIVMTKNMPKAPYQIELIYSLKDEKNFFRGQIFAKEEDIEQLNCHFDYILPHDYLCFLKIHSGFAKSTDTGVLPLQQVYPLTMHLRQIMQQQTPVLSGMQPINPNSLIPFYQSFGRNVFQCFYTEWITKEEIGNVYYSGGDHRISDIRQQQRDMAFITFWDWLVFYLEKIEIL